MSELLSVPEELPRPTRKEFGFEGERLAADFLVREGYRLVAANFTVPIGRNNVGAQVKGEIDLIALDGDTLCFIEVKTRRSTEFAGPLRGIDIRKQRLVTRTARVYRRVFDIKDIKYRFDVVTIVDGSQGEPNIELYKGFWTESKFKKRIWSDDRF